MTVQLKLFKTALLLPTQMPQKADHTHHILEGQAVLYQRTGTSRLASVLQGRW